MTSLVHDVACVRSLGRSFMGLLQDAGLDTLLQTDGPFTLFAPINAVVDELAISETNRTSVSGLAKRRPLNHYVGSFVIEK